MQKMKVLCLVACAVLVVFESVATEIGEAVVPNQVDPPEITSTRCLNPLLPRPGEAREDIRARLEADGAWKPSRKAGLAPPENPQIGDTWDWYIWDLGGYPEANLKPCTVRGMGANTYVIVDDDEWNVSMDQADVDRIVDHFENQSVGSFPDQGIWYLNVSHFGAPPNPLDGLDRIFLLYYRFDIAADGFFWAFDQYPDGSQAFASNEADVVYLATDNGDPGGNYMLGVAAHEFQHMIHYNQDENEDTWLDEGLAELAMWLFGNPDNISGFNANPDNSLIDWGSAFSDYVQTYLWTLYAYEQFGGQPTIWNLTHNADNGMASYLSTLSAQGYSVTMEDVFGDWSLANFIDDTNLSDGRFGYAGDSLPAFTASRSHSFYPASGSNLVVENWATDYIRLSNFSGAPECSFNGIDTRDFRVSMIALDPVLPTLVQPVSLDSANDGSSLFTDAFGYETVIIAVANVHPVGTASYSYNCEIVQSLPIFSDGFESGDMTEWSSSVP